MPGKSTRLVAAVAAALVLVPAGAPAQSGDVFEIHRSAVEIYVRTGDIAQAVTPLQHWKADDFNRVINGLKASNDVNRLRAAAVFHLDIGVALVGISAGSAKGHMDMGESLLDRMRSVGRSAAKNNDHDTLRSIWLGVAGSAFLSVKDVRTAMPYVRAALNLAPKSAHVLTVYGIANEVDASGYNPDDWQTLVQRERSQRERTISLGRAERAYRDALRLEPNYAVASIRLGRVLQLNGKLTEARESLDRGLADARGPFQEYVGNLFMAALLVDQKDLAGARTSYERALAIAPASQPPVVGLAYVELMSGRPDRAQTLFRDFAAASGNASWWAYKDGSLDLPGLAWLRERARQ